MWETFGEATEKDFVFLQNWVDISVSGGAPAGKVTRRCVPTRRILPGKVQVWVPERKISFLSLVVLTLTSSQIFLRCWTGQETFPNQPTSVLQVWKTWGPRGIRSGSLWELGSHCQCCRWLQPKAGLGKPWEAGEDSLWPPLLRLFHPDVVAWRQIWQSNPKVPEFVGKNLKDFSHNAFYNGGSSRLHPTLSASSKTWAAPRPCSIIPFVSLW